MCVAIVLLLLLPAAPAPAVVVQSDLVRGGITVAHVSLDGGANRFAVHDDYPEGQSAAVRYRIGKERKVRTGWNSGGEGSVERFSVAAGGLRVAFRACRANRGDSGAFQCARRWKTVKSSCLKYRWTAVRRHGGACVAVTGQVIHDTIAYSGWAYRLRGQLSAPGTGSRKARFQVRTHRVGESWGGTTTMVKAATGRRNGFDKVVHRGGRVFYASFRICGRGCGPWSEAQRIGQ